MIDSITIENYKAFRSASLELKPLTILLGANSTGKSSLVQLLLLLGQSVQSQNDYDGAFKLNGQYVSCGEGINLLHKKNTSNPLCLTFEFEPIASIENNSIINALRQAWYFFEWANKGTVKDHKSFNDLFRRLHTENSAEAIREILDVMLLAKAEISKIKRYQRKGEKTNDGGSEANDYSMLDSAIDAANWFIGCKSLPQINRVKYDFYYNESSCELETRKITLLSGDVEIISYSNRRSNGHQARDLSSDYFPQKLLNKYRTKFGANFPLRGLTVGSIGVGSKTSFQVGHPVLEVIAAIFQGPLSSVLGAFQEGRINHVSPLRAFPQRYYMIAQSHSRKSLNTKDGDSLVELLKRRNDVRSQVNKWLRNFNLMVDVEGVKDVIHSIKVSQNGLSLDITDVGFGISQVLPVIVQGFVAPDDSITVIEQPEIHLHPKMQADLADLAIEIAASGKNKKLVIETHSEYLLKRLRRRIAEGKIRSEDVAIYLVNGDKVTGVSTLEKVPVEARGSFKWPTEFSVTELEDTIQFALLQPNSISDNEECLSNHKAGRNE